VDRKERIDNYLLLSLEEILGDFKIKNNGLNGFRVRNSKPKNKKIKEFLLKRKIYWTPERIDEAFDNYKKELGRSPTHKEFMKKFGGAENAIFRGRYNEKICSWRDYLIHRGQKPTYEKWTPERIDEAFDNYKKELGRIPSSSEFKKRYDGAMRSIIKRRYNPNISSWKEYIKFRNKESLL